MADQTLHNFNDKTNQTNLKEKLMQITLLPSPSTEIVNLKNTKNVLVCEL